MKRLRWLALCLAAAGALAAPAAAQAPQQQDVHPIFIITAARRAAWARLRDSGHPWAALVADNCAKTGTARPRYGDDGYWCGLLWVFERNHDAAEKAVHLLLSHRLVPANPNDVRQSCEAQVILADWLWQAMRTEQRDSTMTLLNSWVRWSLKGTGAKYVGGFRLHDGDQSSAVYLCAALLDRLAGTHWLDSTMSAPGVGGPFVLGGLGSRGAGRQALEKWSAACAAGGEWDESSEYNPNTMMLVALGYEALRTSGPDSLPTVRRCLDRAAERSAWEVTPDLASAVQWGDEEHPRGFVERLYERINVTGMLAGITRSPVAQGLVARLVNQYGATGYRSAEPQINGGWMIAMFDPTIPADTAPREGTWYAAGRGHLWSQHGSSLFFGEAQPPTDEDHQVGYIFGLQLYRNGEWVIKNPIGYGPPFNLGLTTNGVSYAGFGAMAAKSLERFDSSGVACVTGSTSGPLYGASDEQQPPAFLQIGRRTTCYLQVDGVDVVVTRDTVSIGKPTRLDQYRPGDLARLDSAGGWFAVWHPASMPTRTGNTWTWSTRGAQEVRLTTFSSAAVSDSVLDERALWPKVRTNATLGYQLRLSTPAPVLTTVVVVGSALPVAATPDGVRVGKTVLTFTRSRVSVSTAP